MLVCGTNSEKSERLINVVHLKLLEAEGANFSSPFEDLGCHSYFRSLGACLAEKKQVFVQESAEVKSNRL